MIGRPPRLPRQHGYAPSSSPVSVSVRIAARVVESLDEKERELLAPFVLQATKELNAAVVAARDPTVRLVFHDGLGGDDEGRFALLAQRMTKPVSVEVVRGAVEQWRQHIIERARRL